MSQAAQDAAEPLLQQSVDSPDPELVIDALDDDEEDDFLQPPPESELPLLNGRSYTQPPQDPDTFWTTSMAMSKSILGAGMMASCSVPGG